VNSVLKPKLSKLIFATALFLIARTTVTAHAQAQYRTPLEFSIGYNAIRANAPVGGCGCFYMQGGRAEVGLHLFGPVSGVAEVSGAYAQHINSFGDDISRLTYLVGPRVTHKAGPGITAFAQALIGGAQGFNGYFPTATSSSSSANSFAFSTGGGVDLDISHHLAIRVLQADYLYTRLPNASGDKQNNLRLGAGIVLRIR
jgi:outer membrane immunogenic protein